MTNYTLPYFGQLDLVNLEEYYKVVIELNKNKIRVDLNFKNKAIEEDQINIVKLFLGNIDKFDKQNSGYIARDFNEEIGETPGYINFYLEELDEDELSKIIDINEETKSKNIQLLNKLKLIRVGIYPDDAKCFGIFDYSIEIDGEPCNQLLVVVTNENGNLDHITWES